MCWSPNPWPRDITYHLDASNGRTKTETTHACPTLCETDLTILEVNIRGLLSNKGELSNLCCELKPSIIVFVETFLDASVWAMFLTGFISMSWKTASVISIHKRDSKSNPSLYRPISLLCNISKIMEAVVQNQLQKFILENRLISDRRFGFRPHHTTADILTFLTQQWSTPWTQETRCV